MGNPAIFSGRRTKLLTSKGLQLSDGSLIDNDGVQNYIKKGNPDAEPTVTLVTTGTMFTASKNTSASSRPDSGFVTSGANLLFSVSESSPLGGTKSYIINKDAVNRQGEQAYIPFTIDSKDQAKVLQIEMDYIINISTFVAGTSTTDSSLIVYIYDVTNNVFIEPSTFKFFSNSTTVSDKFIANFQTASNSTSYRLVFHVADTVATQWQIKLDNIKISPSQYVYGTPITDWISYTPTGSWIANTTYTGRWRRVGDTLEAQVNVGLTGAPTVADLTISFLPSGLSIDTAKMATFSFGSVGDANIIDSGSRVYIANPAFNGGTSVYIAHTESGNTGLVNATNPVTFASGDNVRMNLRFPISGWSSSVQQSDGYDGRLIASRMNRITTGQSISGSSDVKVQFNAKEYDKTNSLDVTTNYRFTAPSYGFYRISGMLAFSAGTADEVYALLYKNGSSHSTLGWTVVNTSFVTTIQFNSTIELNANDYVEIYVNPTGTSQTILSSASIFGGTYAQFEKLQAPTTMSATEVVAASYTRASNLTINTSDTDIVWTTKLGSVDTHAIMNTSTGVITFPVQGIYSVALTLRVDTGASASTQFVLSTTGTGIVPNGLVLAAPTDLIASKAYHLAPKIIFTANSGDTLKLKMSSATNASTLVGDQSYIAVEKLK